MREPTSLTIELVESAAQLEEFITLPRRLYAGMKGYFPPLDFEQRELLDPKKSSFFSHGIAAYWIARSRGQAIGRVSAQIDQLKGPNDPEGLGMFGCLDAIDNVEAIARLLATAETWSEPAAVAISADPSLLPYTEKQEFCLKVKTNGR